MGRTISVLLALFAAAVGAPGAERAAGSANLVLSNLRCDHIVNPLGVDSTPPRLSWQIDLGSLQPIDSVRLHAVRYTVAERLGFPHRFRVEAADNP
jgi:hypothetical protein